MGIIMFRLITGHHPYVLNKGKEARQYLKELVNNPLHLKTNFSSKFSIDFQHFFDLILKMISKKESGRIDFDVIFDYIDNTKIFDQFRGKDKKPEKKS